MGDFVVVVFFFIGSMVVIVVKGFSIVVFYSVVIFCGQWVEQCYFSFCEFYFFYGQVFIGCLVFRCVQYVDFVVLYGRGVGVYYLLGMVWYFIGCYFDFVVNKKIFKLYLKCFLRDIIIIF